jgi:hypothetical protein
MAGTQRDLLAWYNGLATEDGGYQQISRTTGLALNTTPNEIGTTIPRYPRHLDCSHSYRHRNAPRSNDVPVITSPRQHKILVPSTPQRLQLNSAR